jgi:hypothetical protein
MPLSLSPRNPMQRWRQRLAASTERYGAAINSYDWLKFIALVIMTIDHIGYYLFVGDASLWWRAVGRITFPVWFFLAGYSQSRQMGGKILWLALFTQAINIATNYGIFPINALLSIVICRYVVLHLRERGLSDRYPLEIFVVCFLLVPLTYPFFEYGALGIAYAIMGDLVRRGKTGGKYTLFFWLTTAMFLLWQHLWFHFTPLQLAFVIIGTAVVVQQLSVFRVTPTHWLNPQGTAAAAVRLVARHTMEYYVLHRTALQILAVLLGIGSWATSLSWGL